VSDLLGRVGAGAKARLAEMQGRLDTQGARLDSQRERIDKVASQAKELAARQKIQLAKVRELVAALTARLGEMETAVHLARVDHGRMSGQVGSLEERLADLEAARQAGPLAATDEERDEAHSLVQAVRREHDQVRVRMQVVSSYEERLRRVEEAVVEALEGQLKRPV
jgi:DNA repair exonuclease SbcCD ATPase subunit